MSSSTKSPFNAAAGADAALTPEQIVEQLRAMRPQIEFADPAPAPVAVRRRLAHVNADFVQAAINAAGASEVLQRAVGRNAEDLRQETDAAARWTAVADELRALLQIVQTANTVRRQRIGLAALQTYKICEQLARDDDNAMRLGAHLAEMKRFNRFGRRRRSATASPPEPPKK